MVLVDTSSWIHFLRRNGNPAVRTRVERALKEGEACWCPIDRQPGVVEWRGWRS